MNDCQDMIPDLNKCLNQDAKIQTQQVDQQQLTECFSIINNRCQYKMNDFLQLIKQYQDMQDMDEFLKQCQVIFTDQPDIYQELKKLLGPYAHHEASPHIEEEAPPPQAQGSQAQASKKQQQAQ